MLTLWHTKSFSMGPSYYNVPTKICFAYKKLKKKTSKVECFKGQIISEQKLWCLKFSKNATKILNGI